MRMTPEIHRQLEEWGGRLKSTANPIYYSFNRPPSNDGSDGCITISADGSVYICGVHLRDWTTLEDIKLALQVCNITMKKPPRWLFSRGCARYYVYLDGRLVATFEPDYEFHAIGYVEWKNSCEATS